MDTVTILRDLWRRRLLVVGVYLLALLAGIAVLYNISFPPKLHSRKYDAGVAQARILIDTPSSQVVDVAAKGSDSLGVRANLIASLMVDGQVESAIAQRAGLKPSQLIGMTDADSVTEPSPASVTPGPHDFVLKTKVLTNTGGDQLPIIEVDAQAPDRAGAAKIASAAVAGLRDYLDSKAALQRIPDADRLQVTGLGAPVARTDVRGPSDIMAIIVVILVFGLGCAAILGVAGLARGWRAASAREQLAGDPLLDDDLALDDDDVFFDEEGPDAEGHHHGDDGPDENWLVPPPRPTLVVPSSPDDSGSIEDDEPQAKTA